jgi:hypothetical protein
VHDFDVIVRAEPSPPPRGNDLSSHEQPQREHVRCVRIADQAEVFDEAALRRPGGEPVGDITDRLS